MPPALWTSTLSQINDSTAGCVCAARYPGSVREIQPELFHFRVFGLDRLCRFDIDEPERPSNGTARMRPHRATDCKVLHARGKKNRGTFGAAAKPCTFTQAVCRWRPLPHVGVLLVVVQQPAGLVKYEVPVHNREKKKRGPAMLEDDLRLLGHTVATGPPHHKAIAPTRDRARSLG